MGKKIWLSMHPRNFSLTKSLACEQALRGAVAEGWEKEGELATTSMKFECLHSKSRCEMMIGRNDISNDRCHYPWHVCFNVCLHSRSFPLRANWRKSDSSVYGGATGRRNSNSKET